MSIESNDRRWSTSGKRLQKRIDDLISERGDVLRAANAEPLLQSKKLKWAYAHRLELQIEKLSRRLRKLQTSQHAKTQPKLFD